MIRFDSERMDHRLRLAAVVAIGILPLLPSINSTQVKEGESDD
jgi:hypothetical protein